MKSRSTAYKCSRMPSISCPSTNARAGACFSSKRMPREVGTSVTLNAEYWENNSAGSSLALPVLSTASTHWRKSSWSAVSCALAFRRSSSERERIGMLGGGVIVACSMIELVRSSSFYSAGLSPRTCGSQLVRQRTSARPLRIYCALESRKYAGRRARNTAHHAAVRWFAAGGGRLALALLELRGGWHTVATAGSLEREVGVGQGELGVRAKAELALHVCQLQAD